MTKPNPRPPIPGRRADRTQLQQIIKGLHEGVILIDPDQSIAWCNEAALAMHGVSTLAELGRTVSEYRDRFELRYRNSHKLPPGDYPMERVLAGEAFTEVVVEVKLPGEERLRVQQIRSMAVTDPDGEPDCLVLVIEDETERFSAEKRFERTFNANPAPAIIARLADRRYVKVNQGFLEMTGMAKEALIGRSMHEYDVLEAAEKRDLANERLRAGITIPQMEAQLRTNTGDRKTVILAGQPIEVGSEPCLLFTFADIQPRKSAEDALRQSEQRFATAFRMAPVPMAMVASEGMRLLDANYALLAATGWPRGEVLGRSMAELGLWDQAPNRDAVATRLARTGSVRDAEVRLHRPGGFATFLLSAETVSIHGETCLLLVMLDVTERKRTEAELNQAIEAVLQDTSWFGQKVVEKLASFARTDPAPVDGPSVSDITPRGREVLGLLAQGLSDEAIATRLGMSRNTVKNHVSAIYRVIGLRRRSELVVWARERGLGMNVKSQQNQAPKRAVRRRAS